MKTTILSALAVVTAVACAAPAPFRASLAAARTGPVVLRPAQISWQDGPAFLPPGAKMGILEGDPARSGGRFTLRLRLPRGYRIAPHTAPADQQLTVVFGQLQLVVGDAEAEPFPMRAYASIPGATRRSLATRGMAVVQVSGAGPWDARYLDPRDDPRRQPPATPRAE